MWSLSSTPVSRSIRKVSTNSSRRAPMSMTAPPASAPRAKCGIALDPRAMRAPDAFSHSLRVRLFCFIRCVVGYAIAFQLNVWPLFFWPRGPWATSRGQCPRIGLQMECAPEGALDAWIRFSGPEGHWPLERFNLKYTAAEGLTPCLALALAQENNAREQEHEQDKEEERATVKVEPLWSGGAGSG